MNNSKKNSKNAAAAVAEKVGPTDTIIGSAIAGLVEAREYEPGKMTTTADVARVAVPPSLKRLNLATTPEVFADFASGEGRFKKGERQKGDETVATRPQATVIVNPGADVDMETLRRNLGERFTVYGDIVGEDGEKTEVRVGYGRFSKNGSIVLQANAKAAELISQMPKYTGSGEERIYLNARNPFQLKQLKDAAAAEAKPTRTSGRAKAKAKATK